MDNSIFDLTKSTIGCYYNPHKGMGCVFVLTVRIRSQLDPQHFDIGVLRNRPQILQHSGGSPGFYLVN